MCRSLHFSKRSLILGSTKASHFPEHRPVPVLHKEKASQSLEAGQAENKTSEKADDAKVPKTQIWMSSLFIGVHFSMPLSVLEDAL